MRRKILMGVLAIALPVGTIAAVQTSAFAGKVTGAGTTTCNFGGTINFNPPLTKSGSTSIKKETTTVSVTLSGCSGGTPVGNATSVLVKPIKTKTTPKGSTGGSCSSFTTASQTAVVKVKVNWAGEKPSKFNINGLTAGINGSGEVGFTGSFPVTGSYAGTGNVAVYLTQASSAQIATCSGSVSTLNIDPANSSGAL